MKTERAVAIIGGGKMGGDIAAVLLHGGWQTHVYEPAAAMRATLKARVEGALKSLHGARSDVRKLRIHPTLDVLPWRDIAWVIEAAPEKLALKRRLFRELEALAPRSTLLTTNSSSLRLTDVAAKIEHKHRAAGVHWLTPAHLAPIVEVVRGEATSALTIRRLNTWLRELGKLPINLNRDVPGMLVNRVQHAMMREAFDLIDRGIVSQQDIDTAVRFSFGFRYVACGPVRQRDLNGLTIHLQAAAQIYPTLHNSGKPPRCLTRLVRAGHVGVSAGRGFYRWDKKTLRQELERYDALLSRTLKLMSTRPAKRSVRS